MKNGQEMDLKNRRNPEETGVLVVISIQCLPAAAVTIDTDILYIK